MAKERGVKFATVPIDLAGDNGAMIAWQGILQYTATNTQAKQSLAGRRKRKTFSSETSKTTKTKQRWRTDECDVNWL